LNKPDKIVVDLSGATLGLPEGDAYDGVARGGITRIRYSQFTRTVVRIVLTLDATHPYAVTNDNGEVRISVEGSTPEFSPWAMGDKAAPATKVETEAKPEPKPEPKAEAKAEPKPEAPAPQQGDVIPFAFARQTETKAAKPEVKEPAAPAAKQQSQEN